MLALAGGIKMHPGIKDELACRGFVCRTLHRLGPSPMADRRLALVGCHQSMPTRRTPIDRARRVQITPAMVALWKRGQEILATKAEQKWEEEGGRRREFLDLAVELHELLDRRPWEFASKHSGLFRDFLLGLPSRGDRPQVLSLHGSIILSLPLGPGRNEFGPAVVRVRTAKSAVAGDHFLHAHFVGWQTAIVRKEIALTSARAPRHLSGLADAKVEQHCHRYGHYDEH